MRCSPVCAGHLLWSFSFLLSVFVMGLLNPFANICLHVNIEKKKCQSGLGFMGCQQFV